MKQKEEPQRSDDYVGINKIIDAAISQLPDYGISKADHVLRTAVIDAYELGCRIWEDVNTTLNQPEQPPAEARQAIAREAEIEMRDLANESFKSTSDWHKAREAIILAAIERSHEPAAQPQRSEPPFGTIENVTLKGVSNASYREQPPTAEAQRSEARDFAAITADALSDWGEQPPIMVLGAAHAEVTHPTGRRFANPIEQPQRSEPEDWPPSAKIAPTPPLITELPPIATCPTCGGQSSNVITADEMDRIEREQPPATVGDMVEAVSDQLASQPPTRDGKHRTAICPFCHGSFVVNASHILELQATDDKQWTADSVMMMFLSADGGQGRASEGYKAIADAHTAELTAERASVNALQLANEGKRRELVDLNEANNNLFRIKQKAVVENQSLKRKLETAKREITTYRSFAEAQIRDLTAEIAAERERYRKREIELIEGWSAVERDLKNQLAAERSEREIIERSRDAWKSQVAGLTEALDAERENIRQRAERMQQLVSENVVLRQQLAAERKKRKEVEAKFYGSAYIQGIKRQLLAAQAELNKERADRDDVVYRLVQAQAAIAEHNRKHLPKLRIYNVDLSAIKRHDAEVREPLVDLLRSVHTWFMEKAPQHYNGCGLWLDVDATLKRIDALALPTEKS